MHPASRPFALLLLALVLPAPGRAADFVVTRYDDPVPDGCVNSGPPAAWDCSLREAVIASVDLASDDRILLSAGTYALARAGADEDWAATGDLDLRGSVEILGPGATMTVLDAQGLDRHFDLRDSAAAGTDQVRISGVALTGGRPLQFEGGASIRVAQVALTLEQVELRGNGGADSPSTVSAFLGAAVTLRESTIRGNTDGGLSFSDATGVLTNSTVANNGGLELSVTLGSFVRCTHCTLWDDEAGAEIGVGTTGTLLRFANSALLGSCTVLAGAPQLDTSGGNLESPGATCGLAGDDLENVSDPRFFPLAANGGPTRTLLPRADSPALGLALEARCTAADQRGQSRDPLDCDSGAVQRSGTAPATPIFHDGFRQGNTGAWSAGG